VSPFPRVLHLDSSVGWGGGQNQVRLLMRELAVADVEQLCICPKGSALAVRLGDAGLPVFGVGWRGGTDPRAIWHVFHALRDYDIVHCHDAHALQIAVLPVRLSRKRVVASRRIPFKTNALKWNRADAVIAVSAHVRAGLMRDGVDAHRIHVIHSGTDAAETRSIAPAAPTIREQHGVPADALVVANAAAMIPLKGQLIIPEAAALLPDVHWFIAGEGPARPQIEAAIAQHDVAERVHLLGWLADARPLFKEASVYLSASTEDGLGNSVTECLALGVPVISADGGGGAEIMRPVHERTKAVLYPPNDAEALANLIRRLRDPAVRTQVVAAQNERFPDFDIRRTAAQTLALYQQLVRS
jgi:L-malate glycosyltransferase